MTRSSNRLNEFTVATATVDLRWHDGVLQQRYLITHQTPEGRFTSDDWRAIPVVTTVPPG